MENKEIRDFSKYDSMQTEELLDLLRLDSEAQGEQAADTEELLYIMEVVAARDPGGIGKTPQEAWSAFQENYLSGEEGQKPAPVCRKLWLRRVAAIAAILSVLICIPLITIAVDWEEIRNGAAIWTEEDFRFVNDDTVTTIDTTAEDLTEPPAERAETEEDWGFDFMPTWLPEGYETAELTLHDMGYARIYVDRKIKEAQTMMVVVTHHNDGEPYTSLIEKDDGPVEIYESNGVRYYIFTNLKYRCISWLYGPYECVISGEFSVEEAKIIIDSIGKG